MCGLHVLLPASGESFMSKTPLEACLLREMVTCSIHILSVYDIKDAVH